MFERLIFITYYERFGVDCEIENLIQIFGNDWNRFIKFVKRDAVLHLGVQIITAYSTNRHYFAFASF